MNPEDVVLKAFVSESDVTACLPDVAWVVEVELDRTRAVSLHAGEGRYMSEVNVFNGERPLAPDDTGTGCGEGRGDFGDHLSIGNDGRTYALAVRAAHKSGDLPVTYPETQSSATGFTYLGSEFPVKVRYYLREPERPRKIAVVYAHYEVRFGKDYSWTKTVYTE